MTYLDQRKNKVNFFFEHSFSVLNSIDKVREYERQRYAIKKQEKGIVISVNTQETA